MLLSGHLDTFIDTLHTPIKRPQPADPSVALKPLTSITTDTGTSLSSMASINSVTLNAVGESSASAPDHASDPGPEEATSRDKTHGTPPGDVTLEHKDATRNKADSKSENDIKRGDETKVSILQSCVA